MKSQIHTLVALSCFAFGHFSIAKQQSTVQWTTAAGTKEMLDIKSGATEIREDGTTVKISAAELGHICEDLEKYPSLAVSHDGRSTVVLCEYWGELQPRTQIAIVPFSTLITRLLLISPPSTNFSRYRGMELKSDGNSKLYDAIIVPDGLGKDLTCTIAETPNPSGGSAYLYHCSIKTASYAAAVELQSALVSDLNGLHLDEDHVREHGFAAKDKVNNECAPTGECAHSKMFVSAPIDGKVLTIEAEPEFLRNAELDIRTIDATGHHSYAQGIAPNSASVEFSIWSFRAAKEAAPSH